MRIAHRGIRNKENTISGIQKASMIADIVEVDVRFNTNLEIILCHDRANRNSAELETLEQLCQFEEPMHLMIDIKAFGITPAILIAEYVYSIITKYPIHLYELCSFNEFCVKELLRLRESDLFLFNVGIITSGIPLEMFDNLKDIDFVSMDYNIICEDIVELFHKRDKRVYAWTVNDLEMQEYVLTKCLVDGIIFDIFD
jgi:glycerophosphoryl diester phosphodiesterase